MFICPVFGDALNLVWYIHNVPGPVTSNPGGHRGSTEAPEYAVVWRPNAQ